MKNLFVTCSGGLEELLEQELQELGYTTQPGFRGVYVFNVSMREIYHINYCSRIAVRVLLPLRKFKCYDKKSLYFEVSKVDWTEYIPKDKTFAIDANVKHRNIKNSLFAAQVVKDVICDQFRDKFGYRPSVDLKFPDVQLNLFINQDNAVLSFDTSGEPLYKRGYRQQKSEAPLQETLAAAMLYSIGYSGKEALCDPCCGSGTLLIEAAMVATNTGGT